MEGKEGIVEAMLYLSPLFPITTTVRYCRNIARGIVYAVREKKIDMLIMGWHGRPRAHTFSLGSTIDPIVERVPCNVVVLKDCGDRQFNRVLVPLGGGPNGALALELAAILADKEESEIVVLNVSDGRRTLQRRSVRPHTRGAPGAVQWEGPDEDSTRRQRRGCNHRRGGRL